VHARSDACIPLALQIDKNLGNPRDEKGVGPYAYGSKVDTSLICQQRVGELLVDRLWLLSTHD
jgi:hypothetical protein